MDGSRLGEGQVWVGDGRWSVCTSKNKNKNFSKTQFLTPTPCWHLNFEKSKHHHTITLLTLPMGVGGGAYTGGRVCLLYFFVYSHFCNSQRHTRYPPYLSVFLHCRPPDTGHQKYDTGCTYFCTLENFGGASEICLLEEWNIFGGFSLPGQGISLVVKSGNLYKNRNPKIAMSFFASLTS